MTKDADNADTLQTHVEHLRYAVATTGCRATVAVLRNMLSKAEARVQKGLVPVAPDSKMR